MSKGRSSAEPPIEQADCPLCRGEVPHDLVRAVLNAQPGEPMSAEKFKDWLRAVGTDS